MANQLTVEKLRAKVAAGKPLTDLHVKNVKASAAPEEVRDGSIPGMVLLIHPSGAKSFAVRFRIDGHLRKLTLGKVPRIGLGDARRLAKVALGRVAKGEDPTDDKRKAKAAAKARAMSGDVSIDSRFEDVRDVFVAKHAKRKRAATAEQTERLLKREFASLDKRRLGDITSRDVRRIVEAIEERGRGVTANRSLAIIKKLFNWCVEREIIEASPIRIVSRPAKEESRDRVLDDGELRAVWRACDNDLPYPYPAIVRLLILTGARKLEIGEMRWSELDLDAGLWTLSKERAKNGRELVLPLPEQAVAILRSIPPIHRSDFVFTIGGDHPVSAYARAMTKLREVLPDTPHWSLHDLRRTAASGMARLGIAPHVVEAVLNHKTGTISAIAAIYNRYDLAVEKRAALEAWASYVERLVSDTSNVAPLQRIGGTEETQAAAS
jgi:integrase